MDTQEITLSQDASKKVLIGTMKYKSSKESHPNSWQRVRLGEVCKATDLVNPAAHPENPFTYIDVSSVSNESYQIIETRRILGKDAPSRARKSVQADDVIFATVRPTLKRVAIIPSELNGQVCSTGFCVLRANRKILKPQYLYFLLLTEFVNQRVESLQKGATYPAINDSDLFNLMTPLPPISEQDAIAHVLQRVQEAIQTRRDELELERERKAALMEYLFTHGTRGETTKQTEIGEIPESWQVVELGEIITLHRGYDLPTRDRKPGIVPIISSSGISGTHSEAKVTAPGVVTGRYGTIGEVFYIEQDFWPLNTTLYVSEFRKVTPHFVAYLMRTLNFNIFNDKSTVPGVNRNDLHRIKTVLPLPSQQHDIVDVLSTHDTKLSALEQETTLLEELFRALLEELMTGRLSTLPLIEERETHE